MLLHPVPAAPPGVHPSAMLAPTARVAASACIGAVRPSSARARRVGERAFVGAGCVVGDGRRRSATTSGWSRA